MHVLDELFKQNILEITRADNAPSPDRPPDVIDERYDALADHAAPWSEWKRANFGLMRRIAPSRQAALVATVRNEGLYLIEWIAHHRAVGFERIILYTNDNSDGSGELLHLLHRHGLVRLIENRRGADIRAQVKAYEHSLHFLRELRDYEWVAYLDADEFLIPHAASDHSVGGLIRAVRERYPGQHPMAVCLNWFWMSSEGAVRRRNGLVQDVFQRGAFHNHVKSLVRLDAIDTMWAIHIPDPARNWCVNGDLNPISLDCVDTVPKFHYGRINHYYNKSFEEHVFKIERSRTGGPHFVGKTYDMFFRMDREGDFTTWPVPEEIAVRTRDGIAAMMGLPGIADAVATVEEAFAARSRTTFPEGLDAAYRAAAPVRSI